jgi:hypothetical protein
MRTVLVVEIDISTTRFDEEEIGDMIGGGLDALVEISQSLEEEQMRLLGYEIKSIVFKEV